MSFLHVGSCSGATFVQALSKMLFRVWCDKLLVQVVLLCRLSGFQVLGFLNAFDLIDGNSNCTTSPQASLKTAKVMWVPGSEFRVQGWALYVQVWIYLETAEELGDSISAQDLGRVCTRNEGLP